MSKILLYLLLLSIPVSGFSQSVIEIDSTSFNRIIGLEREQAHKEVNGKPWGGIVTGYVEPSEVPIMTWSFSVIEVDKEKVFTLVEILNDDDPQKKNKFLIRDQLMISSSNPDHLVDIGCKINGESLYPDGRYMGLYLYTGKETYTKIIKAWKIDFEKSQFIEISTEGMKCDPDYYSVPLDKEI